MPDTVRISDLLAAAIQVEKNGRDYFDQAAKNVKAEKVGQALAGISDDEQQHIAAIEALQERLERDSRAARIEHTQEYAEYLAALIWGTLFTQPKQGTQMARTVRNDKHALEMALAFEKDALLVYREIKHILPDDYHPALDEIIACEQGHISRIADMLKGFNKFGVSGPPTW